MPKLHVVIYYNVLCQRAKRYAQAYERFFNHQQYKVATLASTASRHQDIEQLRQHCKHATECVVIGGDGSMNIAANVLAHTATALSAIPMGTGNDFAYSQGLTHWRWRMRNEVIQQTQAIGRVQPANSHMKEQYFVNHVGCGLSVDLMALQPRWLKQSVGKLSYSIALLRYLFGRESLRSRIRHASHWDDGQIVALGRCIGGGITVYPQATRQHTQLAWIGIPKMPRWCQLKALFNVWRGHVDRVSELEYAIGQQFSLGDAEHRIELDGDIYFHGPATVSAVANALVVTLPVVAAQKS
ncbi:diacylglycerol/lipid kinase family protein [Pseudidiomarina donghaiensis]|uniref:DAGKc domain-containing protein n=1 Tax=Pseudidiomarina donghaiensis TaxID=519452 RepID=A0A432XBZ3_9GAMM|nr:diacylglycerol kinase family protein [Pseudidiomarina donghaiensis]RUO46215.1 hypothetical protein CWE24_11610 [Pseudidiomarina donghaiensis]SFV24820.1 Diacylglycerol kinase family enzyme [Pseudidiomarina donghaiensis]